jgi:hypothetical protein
METFRRVLRKRKKLEKKKTRIARRRRRRIERERGINVRPSFTASSSPAE